MPVGFGSGDPGGVNDGVDPAVGVFDAGEEPVDLPVDREIGDGGGRAATDAGDVLGDLLGRLRNETVCDDVESVPRVRAA